MAQRLRDTSFNIDDEWIGSLLLTGEIFANDNDD